jgi:AhpD family alkylhydroperoxidase
VIHLIEHDQAPLLARPFYADGDPGPIVAALAHVPELLEVAVPFIGVALGASAIDARTKEIVIVRTSAMLGCRYCVDTHTPIALTCGLDAREVRALRDETGGALGDAFPSARDRALVTWVDEVATGRGAVREECTAALREHVSDAELVELTVLVGATMMLNRFATALELPLSEATLQQMHDNGFAVAELPG